MKTARTARQPANLLALVCLLAAGSAWAQDRYVCAVGHNLGLPGEEPLRYAEQDAERFADLMTELGGAPSRNTLLLQSPKVEQVLEALDEQAAAMRARPDGGTGAVLTFFFAGHGDAQHLHLAGQRLGRADLLEHIEAAPAGFKLVVLDACQTPESGRERGVRSGPSFDIGVLRPESAEGLVVISSTRAGDPAHESDALGGAVFTHYLLSGLRGAGDLDRDGRVTLTEAYGFAFRHTVRHSASASSVVQRPSFDLELAGSGEVVLTWPVEAGAILVLPPGREVRHLVFHQPSGALIAEAVSSTDQPLALAVRSGRLLVQRRSAESFQVAEVDLPYGGRYLLAEDEFEQRPYETVARRGGRLDLHPNAVAAGYLAQGAQVGGVWVLRHGLELAYGHAIGRVDLGLELGLAWSDYQHGLYANEELSVALRGRIGFWLPLGPTRLEFALGPEVLLLFQERRRADSDELRQAGLQVPAPVTSTAMGAGGGGQLAWRIPLGLRLGLVLSVRAAVLATRVKQTDASAGWEAIPVVGTGLSLSWRF